MKSTSQHIKLNLSKAFTLLMFFCAFNLYATSYSVTNNNDSGAGSLRQAITDAVAAGNGPHDITFDASYTILLTTNLPTITITDLTIDGEANSIIIQAHSSADNNARSCILLGAGADGFILKNVTLQNPGLYGVYASAAIDGVTIENVDINQDAGTAYIDYFIYFASTADNISITDCDFDYIQAALEGIYVVGAATSFDMTNCNLSTNVTGTGEYGILFAAAVSNSTFTDLTINDYSVTGVHFATTTNNVTFKDFTFDNTDGGASAAGFRFIGAATTITFDEATLNMDYGGGVNEGDYGIYFGSTLTTCTMDSVTISNVELHSVYVAGASSNFTSSYANITNGSTHTASTGMYFVGAVTTASFTNDTISMYNAGADDGDYCQYFAGASSGLTYNNCYFYDADYDEIRFVGAVTTASFTSCEFIADSDLLAGIGNGVNFVSAAANSGLTFTSCTFDNLGEYGMIIDATNASTAATITSCTFSNTQNHDGLLIELGDGVRAITITTCTFSDNADNGLQIDYSDDIQVTQCSFYGNGAKGIDNGVSGNCDYEYGDGDIPVINSSAKDGDVYTVNYTLPAICSGGDCDVEFFVNDNTDSDYQARQYVTIESSKSNTTYDVDITCTTGECLDATAGYWTATLYVDGCTSEISAQAAMGLDTVAPGNVSIGLELWLKADAGAKDTGGASPDDAEGVATWEDQSQEGYNLTQAGTTADEPIYYSSTAAKLLNFNPTLDFTTNEHLENVTAIFGASSDFSFIAVATDEDATTGRQTLFSACDNNDDFNFNKEGSTTNGWELYLENAGAADNLFPSGGIGFAPDGGSNGYYNGASYTRDEETEFTVPQVVATTGEVAVSAIPTNYLDGVSYTHPVDTETDANYFQSFTLGSDYTGNNNDWTGRIPEVIAYSAQVSAADMQKINTYLAIKYGITLGQSGTTVAEIFGNVADYDYLDTDGNIIWDASVNNTYKFDIAGIGRDDDEGLGQVKSKSQNPEAILTIEATSEGSNATNSFVDIEDQEYLIWGNNGGTQGFTKTNAPSGYVKINRTWYIQESTNSEGDGDVGACTFSFDVDDSDFDIPVPVEGSSFYIMYETTDADFSTGSPTTSIMTDAGSGIWTFSLDISASTYFSIGILEPGAPGGIVDNLSVWFKADAGVYSDGGSTLLTTTGTNNAQEWHDQSGNPIFVSNQPADGTDKTSYTADNINYNPSINIVDTDDGFDTPSNMYRADFLGENTDEGTMYTVFNYVSGAQYAWIHRGGNNTSVGYGASEIGQGTNSDYDVDVGADFAIVSCSRTTGTADNDNFLNGEENGTGGTNTNVEGTLPIEIGYSTFEGEIAEIIVYEVEQTAAERQKVEAYLAIKYGITITNDNDGDGTILEASNAEGLAEGDYISSDGTVVWNANDTASENYHYDVAGIAKDDDSGLDQPKSKSENTDAILYVEADAAITDGRYLVWGNNNDAITWTSTNAPASYNKSERTWIVEENNGDVGTSTFAFDVDDAEFNIPALSSGSVYYIISKVGSDDFSGETPVALTNSSGSIWEADINMADNTYFTIATQTIPAPGAVTSNLIAWYKADAGTTGTAPMTAWTDQSTNTHDLTNAGDPALTTDALNYNPAATFDGTGDWFITSDGGVLQNGVTYDDISVFIVNTANTSNVGIQFCEATSASSGNRFGGHLPYSNGSAYWDYPNDVSSNGRASGGTSVSNGEPYVWSLLTSRTVGQNVLGASDYKELLFNGTSSFVSTSQPDTETGTTGEFFLGARDNSASEVTEDIAELIIYDKVVTAAELLQIESYLGIKYGVTLSTNYVASDATVVWDASTNSSYHYDVAGIGRDDNQELSQIKSKSENNDGILTVFANGEGTSNTFTDITWSAMADKEYFIWGNNDGAITMTATNAPTDCEKITRTWYVEESADVGTLTFTFDVDDADFNVPALTCGATNYVLMYDSDVDLSGGSIVRLYDDGTTAGDVTGSDGIWTNNTINLASGTYFSIGQIDEFTWTGDGADDNWSTDDNWLYDVAPAEGNALVFAGATRTTPVNDYAADTDFASISFDLGASAFTLSGNAVEITGGGCTTGDVTTGSHTTLTMTIGNNITYKTNAPTITTTSGGTIDFTGTIANGGFDITNTCAGTTVFSGIISGSGAIIKNGAGAVSLGAANTYTGGVNLNVGTLNINHATALGAVGGAFVIADGTTINASTGAVDNTADNPITIGGDFTFTGTNTLDLGDGTITMAASRVITTSASVLTMGGALTSAGNNLTSSGGGELAFVSQAVTIANLNITAGTLTSTSGILSISGDYDNDGTFTHNSGTVTFNGTTDQALGTSAGTQTFYNLVINNTGASASDDIILADPVTVTNVVTLTDGIINTDATNLLTLSNTATGAISGGSAGTFVSGPLSWDLTTGTSYTFPIGVAPTTWMRIGLSALTGATNFTAQYFGAGYGDATVTGALNNASTIEYWDVTEVNAAVDADLTLYWENATTSDINSCAAAGDLVVAHFDGTDWESFGNAGGVTGTCAGGDDGTVKASTVTSFSPFSFGSNSGGLNPLPIELLSFTAFYNGSFVDIEWETASETNNDYFTIERSIDGINFEIVENYIPSKAENGFSASTLSYSTEDLNDLSGIYYYRLKQTDFDSQFEYSGIQVVTIKGVTDFVFSIAPNPSQGANISIFITADEYDEINVKVHDILGQFVHKRKFQAESEGNNSYPLVFPRTLSAGVYIVTASINGHTVSKRMVVE